jgi:phenylalanyl-tRNA synthetase alpha chain
MKGINISDKILDLQNRNLHLVESHPIKIIKELIQGYFNFKNFDNLEPFVTTKENFDDLLIPKDHPSRSLSDTYYFDENHVLRTHTSAHQTSLLNKGEKSFLVSGPVFRRDEIDSSHYPVFHQMEGLNIIPSGNKEDALEDLKKNISGLIEFLFPEAKYEMVPSYFPFTEPSLEVEIEWNNKKLEVLGCGVIQPKILSNCNVEGSGWAFGLGLERLAMILFDIPDIRLFWTEDSRFLTQFSKGKISKFEPYSKYPICYKDISFWIPENYSSNDFYEYVREIFGDLTESVKLIDNFTKNGKISHCYRIACRSLDRSLSNEEIDLKISILKENLLSKNFIIR